MGEIQRGEARARGRGSRYSRRGRVEVAPANGRPLHGLADARLYSCRLVLPASLRSGLGVPSMGRIELAERSQPEEMTPTVAKRNAEPRGEGGKKRVANPWP